MKLNSNSFTRVLLIALAVIMVNSNVTMSQTSEKENTLSKKANMKYQFSDYNNALPLYLELAKTDSLNFIYNYRIGVCYLKSNVETSKSLGYFEKALACKPPAGGATFEFYFYMASAYKITNQFEKALGYFQVSKTMKSSVDSLVEIEITNCKNGIRYMSEPTGARIFNLGANVNSIYPDYSPILLFDRSALVFTSTRKGSTGEKKSVDGGDYYEDIYVAKNTSPKQPIPAFSEAKNIMIPINTFGNDAALNLSADGGILFMARKNKLRQATVVNGVIGRPKKYKNDVIHKAATAPSMFFSSDDSTLYFVSSALGGFGGKDLFKSTKRPDGTWGPAENLGAGVNTNLDEESPYFDISDSTLYFSSQGHNSMGGYDVCVTKYKGGKWVKAKNLGYPLNSGTDDLFFTYNKSQNMGYYTTMRENGVGNYDIYMVRFTQPAKVMLSAHYEGGLTPKDLNVTIIGDNDTTVLPVNDKNKISYNSNSSYKLLIPQYNDDNVVDTLYFTTPETVDREVYLQEFNFLPIKGDGGLTIGYKTMIYNAFFDVENAIVKSDVRRNQVLLTKFPMCESLDPKYSYYANPSLTKDEEYSKFIKTLKPDFKNFKIYSQSNYLDSLEILKVNNLFIDTVKKAIVVAEPEVEILSFESIFFDFAQFEIERKYGPVLDSIVSYMKKNKEVRLVIEGYTDSVGSSKYNNRLAEDRALYVKRILMKKGANPFKITSKGMGEYHSGKSDTERKDEKGNPINNSRRVDFIFSVKKK